MQSRFLTLLFLWLAGFTLGCEEFEQASKGPASTPVTTTQSQPASSGTTAPTQPNQAPVASTVAAQPSDWDQAQVEQWLRQEMKLTELKLSSAGTKKFQGTGKDATGKSFEIKVTQSADRIECEHSSTPGSTGAFMLGNAIKQ